MLSLRASPSEAMSAVRRNTPSRRTVDVPPEEAALWVAACCQAAQPEAATGWGSPHPGPEALKERRLAARSTRPPPQFAANAGSRGGARRGRTKGPTPFSGLIYAKPLSSHLICVLSWERLMVMCSANLTSKRSSLLWEGMERCSLWVLTPCGQEGSCPRETLPIPCRHRLTRNCQSCRLGCWAGPQGFCQTPPATLPSSWSASSRGRASWSDGNLVRGCPTRCCVAACTRMKGL
eukprot:4209325-Prymnesium_polylepis.1